MFLQAGHQDAKISTTTGFPCSSWASGAPIEFDFALEAQGLALEAQGLALEAQGLALDAQGLALTATAVVADVLVVATLGVVQPAMAPKPHSEIDASTAKY